MPDKKPFRPLLPLPKNKKPCCYTDSKVKGTCVEHNYPGHFSSVKVI